MEEGPSNRQRKLTGRAQQRENKKHDAKGNRHRDRGLAQTKPIEKEQRKVEVPLGSSSSSSSEQAEEDIDIRRL